MSLCSNRTSRPSTTRGRSEGGSDSKEQMDSASGVETRGKESGPIRGTETGSGAGRLAGEGMARAWSDVGMEEKRRVDRRR